MKKKFLAVIILIFSSTLMTGSIWDDSLIVDEIPHIGAGYSYVVKQDFRLNPEHPPLAKDLAGLALLTLDLKQSAFQTRFWNQDINGQWEFGRNFIFNSGNDAIRMIRIVKLPMLIFFILSGLLIFKWGKKLYGSRAGLIAVFLFSFSPTIMAHSRFVTTDMAALFGTLLGFYFFIQFLEHPGNRNRWFAGLTLGVALLTKFSTFLIIPLFFVLAIIAGYVMHGPKIRNIARTVGSTILIVLIGFIFVVWPVYGLHTLNYPPEKQRSDTEYYLATYGNRYFADPVLWASDKPFIRSLDHYATGLLMVNQRAVGGNTAYFLGEIKNTAWKKYFPVVYFIKEPLAFWGLLAIALIFWVVRPNINKYKITHWPKEHFPEFAMLLWLAMYWYISINSNLNIGVRHLIPTYGFVFILLAGALSKLIEKPKIIISVLIFGLFGWYFLEALRIYPYYLTYFNQAVGGPEKGHIYVVDSNLDWGQDLKRLSQWVKDNNIKGLNLDYFGWADQSYYLGTDWVWINSSKYKNAQDFLRQNPRGGYIAVSATFYMGNREKPESSYAWLDSYKPIGTIGNSIFVWHITP